MTINSHYDRSKAKSVLLRKYGPANSFARILCCKHLMEMYSSSSSRQPTHQGSGLLLFQLHHLVILVENQLTHKK